MSKQYTPEQQELFTKVSSTFNRLNMNGQGDASEKINFKNGELSMMKKDGKVMIEHKGVMQPFGNLASLEKFLEENLAYYMNKINGKMAKAELLESNGIKPRNGKVSKAEAVKAAYLVRNDKLQKTEAFMKVEVDDKYKEFFSHFDNLKSTFTFLDMAEKELGCPLEWSDDEKCFYVYDNEVKCNPEDLKKLLPNLIAEGETIQPVAKSETEVVMAGLIDCPACYGDGNVDIHTEKGDYPAKCKKCNGSGKVSGVAELMADSVWDMFQDMATEPNWDQDQVDEVVSIVKKKKPQLAADFEKFVDMAGDLSNNYSELNVANNKKIQDEIDELEAAVDKGYTEVVKFFDEKIRPHLKAPKQAAVSNDMEKPYNGELTVEKLKALSAALVEVQNCMKEGMHDLNLAIMNKDVDAIMNSANIKKLIKACNDASTDDAATVLWN